MFAREKRIGAYTYVYLVETVREGGKVKQRIIRNLGRKEDVARRGDLDRLARSAARIAQRSIILSLVEQGSVPTLVCKRIGPPCCSSAYGAIPAAAKFCRSCLPIAASGFLSSAPSSSPSCIGSWCPAPIAPVSNGGRIIASRTSIACNSITSIARWL